jgi:outer membrane protein assembly factor BamA
MSRQHELEGRLRELKREEALLEQQLAIQEYAGSYEISLQWPAIVVNGATGAATATGGGTKTDHDLIQHRLLEAGLLYEVPVPTADAVAAASSLIQNLEATDCFHSVRVDVGGKAAEASADDGATDAESAEQYRSVTVELHEKNWYRLHAGAGLKTSGSSWMGSGVGSSSGSGSSTSSGTMGMVSTDSFLPLAEVDVSVGLRNVFGYLDRTDLNYSLDTHNIGTWALTHERPLYTVLPTILSNALLEQMTGSQYAWSTRAVLDTVDYTGTSSYQLFQRLVSVKAATVSDTARHLPSTRLQQPWYGSIEWGLVHRDVVPRRHPTLPYHFAASPDIVAQAGATVKHGWTATVQYDSTHSDSDSAVDDRSRLPVSGIQFQCTGEVATPPGDVGFVKGQAAMATHLSLTDRLAIHGSLSTGYLHMVSFGGLCSITNSIVADRFMMGGPGSFRGFVPTGIGPRSRARPGTKLLHTDALGGNFFYTATAMASLTPSTTSLEALAMLTRHVRLFGFATVGTCLDTSGVTSNLLHNVVNSSRASAGIGIATQALGPARVEATYAWPLRYGPNDGRRRFQFGVSFSI